MPPTEPTRFCLQCGYALDGLTSAACPECGRGFDPEDERTYRTRGLVRWYWLAIGCGATPLIVGTSIFVLWLLTDWQALMAAGMATILGGTVLVFLGAIFLAAHLWQGRGMGLVRTGPVVAAIALLVINFPVALAITSAAVRLELSYIVWVHNASATEVASFVVVSPSQRIEFGPIGPGETIRRTIPITGDGQLTFEASHDGKDTQGMLEGYVTNSMGGRTQATITKTGEVEVERRER